MNRQHGPMAQEDAVTATQQSTVTKQFVQAGRAVFTADNGKGMHYTFQVSRSRDQSRPPVYFVSVLTGPDNTSDYTYAGLLDPQAGTVRLTARSRFTDDATSIKVLRFALRVVYGQQQLPDGYSLRHEGRCCRCGRALTRPESIATGIGPECATRMN